jgi:hypothetical protein
MSRRSPSSSVGLRAGEDRLGSPAIQRLFATIRCTDAVRVDRSARATKLHARPQMAKPARFEAAGGSGLDDPAVLRTALVDRAREEPLGRDVERRAARPAILHEAPPGAATVERGVALEEDLTHPRVVPLEEVNRPRSVVAAPPARDAITPVGVGLPMHWRYPLPPLAVQGTGRGYASSGHLEVRIRGSSARSRSRSAVAVARCLGSRRSAELSISPSPFVSGRPRSALIGGGVPS